MVFVRGVAQSECSKTDFSDSVLCLGKMGDNPIESWKKQIQWYSNNLLKDISRIDGKPIEFEWKIFPGFTTAGILKEIQRMMCELQYDPADFNDRNIFVDANGNDELLCVNDSKMIEQFAERSPRGHWCFLERRSKKKWYGTYDSIPDGSRNRTAEKMLQTFKDSGHPILRCTSPLEKGQLRSKGGGIRSHVGSSHFLFERARCFSRSRAFLVLSCPSVYNPVL